MSVNTDIIGAGRPAALAATSRRIRAQSSTMSSALPRSLARSASPRPMASDGRVGGDRRHCFESRAPSRSAPTMRDVAAERGERGVDVTGRLDLGQADGELAGSRAASASRSAAEPALTRTSTTGGLASADASQSTTCRRAASLWPAATASSRSRITSCAPVATALAKRSGRSPGTYSAVTISGRLTRLPRSRSSASSSGVDADLAEHLGGVGPVRAAGPADRPGVVGQAEQHVLHLDRSQLVVVDGVHRAERRVLRVGHHAAHVVDRPDRRLGRLEGGRAPRPSARAAIQAPTASSSSSACSARWRPVANHGCSTRSARPTRRIDPLGDRLRRRARRRPTRRRRCGRRCAGRC